MVIDELFAKRGTELFPIDSYDGEMIEEINYEGNTYHFANQRDIEGETQVVADNSVDEPIISLAVEGNTVQQTYSGKNLFDENNIIKGYSTGNIDTITPSNAYRIVKIDNLKAGTYTISFSTPFYLVRQWIDGQMKQNLGTVNTTYTFTTTTDNTYGICFRKSDSSEIIEDFTVQVEKGSTATEYEPYVGGTASPNPDFPQPIHNANDNGMSLELRGKNLFDGNANFSTQLDVTKEFTNSVLTIKNGGNQNSSKFQFKIPVTIGKKYTVSASSYYMSASVYGLAIGNTDNPDKSEYGKRLNANNLSVTFTATTDTLYLKSYVSWGKIINEVVVTDLQVEEGSTKTPYEPYFNTTIAIPPSVTVEGTTVPLRFSIYDKIIVDRLNGKVTYSSGTWYKEFNGNEIFYQSTFAENNGYGRYYIFSFDISATGGYCSHFKRSGWLGSKTVKNVFSWVEVNSTYNRIAFKTDGNKDDTFANSLVEFKALLKSLYDTGTPVTVLAKLKTSVEYDITNTDLGQELLALATHKGTNIFTISSELPVSKTALSYWRQIIPNE